MLVGYFDRSGATCKIRFSDFKTWYPLAPDKWDINDMDNFVTKRGHFEQVDGNTKYISGVCCYFGLFDYMRYKVWRHKRKTNSERLNKYQEKESLLRSVQLDIDAAMEQVQRDREDAVEILRRVAENPDPESPVEDFMKIWRGIKIH
jgi:hypothetical protein